MKTANQFACWSILGLLSSACCAIQIILNAFSMGCASFNTVLGPLRPMFVALTVMAQGASWFTAFQNGLFHKTFRNDFQDDNTRKSLQMVVAGSIVSLTMTIMPEILAWNSIKRQSVSKVENRDGNVIDLKFRIESMGCASCVSTVSKVLEACDGILKHSVSFEKGVVYVTYNREKADVDKAWTEIQEKLTDAGFPPNKIEG
ncbi:copper-transporting ATPase-like protein [Chaetoceros tenuissimus]|uniref:Copper-transporting ATPase-like protein n=1 Tax=Chaetoceros tenuissimus TaxID=426638 RepID=A0AAD3D2Y3_9STRA|nr:copper-transporting ATPase-like protein [Chaetoceros tenuissimus]